MSDPKNYIVGWICAITPEYVAAQAFLDEIHADPDYLPPNNKNEYTLGRIGKHNVVISVLPLGSYGSASAAQVAESMLHSFPNVRIGLLVGIGGGVPSPCDVRLGDVVVSAPFNGKPGVIQYDFSNTIQGQSFRPTGFLDQSPTVLRAAVTGLQARYEREGNQLKDEVEKVLKQNPRLWKRYKHPEPVTDRLYQSHVVHPLDGLAGSICAVDRGDHSSCLISRTPRLDDEDDPVIHYGSIASANQLMQDALIRDQFAKENGILCFEMEAAGLMNNFPCLVIRGICDYSDTHQDEYSEWRGYAAMIAAAYARDLLHRISPRNVEGERKILEVLKISIDNIVETTDHMAKTTDRIDQSLALDRLPVASGAEYNSYVDQYEVECLLGTRTELLQQIKEWAFSPHGKCLFWLNGMAGTGKSTISRTVAKSLGKNLGASFFFKRGEGDRGNARKLFPTLVRQLVLRCPLLVPSVQKALETDPDLASKSLGEQFHNLLLQPLLNLDESGQMHRPENIVIVLDALDECDHDQDIRSIIRLLPILQKAHFIRIRVFLTSRPELPIRFGFKNIANHDYQDLALHNIPEEITGHDISLFLQDRFAKLRLERDVPHDWPSDKVIQNLAAISVPLFISAATVCRYIEHSKMDPILRLEELIQDQTRYATKMEKTYMPILARLVDDIESDEMEQQQLLQDFQCIVGVIVLLAVPLSIHSLSEFIDFEPHLIRTHLDSFQSVLNVPGISDQDSPIRILHLSFRDFLVQSNTKFHVDELTTHKHIARFCLETMDRRLMKNICNLDSPGTERRIYSRTIRETFSPELRYACRYWVHHFISGEISDPEISDILVFLKFYFLNWVEAMSLLGLISEVVVAINYLQIAIPREHNSEILDFLYDAKRFTLRISHIVDEAPLQLYCAGLAFAPEMSIIRQEFEKDIPSWICQLPQVDKGWTTELQNLMGHSGTVNSVAFSPDGRLLASGSADRTLKLWDPTTGKLQQTIEGPAPIESVVFSPDGRLVASVLSGVTLGQVQLLDPTTGELQQTIESSDEILCVAFSPDGCVLASGSKDKTVRLWDLKTGEQQHIFNGQGEVTQVALSLDGHFMAFRSADKETDIMPVQLWDLAAGVERHTIDDFGDSGALAFSPDSRLLAFGVDGDICLWDLVLGALQRTIPETGPDDMVDLIAFSSNGCLIGSCGARNGVRIWNLATGELLYNPKGDGFWTKSIAFSPDSRLFATGSLDKIVRLSDLTIEKVQDTAGCHKGKVNALAFSPDGQLLASGSSDYTVRLWDSATGELKRTIKHPFVIFLLAFSPDGQKLALGAPLEGVWILDLATGTVQQQYQLKVECLAFSPDSHLLGCIQKDGKRKLLNFTTSGEQELNADVMSVVLWPNGRLLATGSSDGVARLWDTTTGLIKQSWTTGTSDLSELLFHQDGFYLYNDAGILYPRLIPIDSEEYPGIFDLGGDDTQWLEWNSQRILWLGNPSDVSEWTIHGDLLALGRSSGQVFFMKVQRPQETGGSSTAWKIST